MKDVSRKLILTIDQIESVSQAIEMLTAMKS
jgi:hypothetical protein